MNLTDENDYAEENWKIGLSNIEVEAIEEGLADIEAGRTVSHEEVRKRYEKWLWINRNFTAI